MEGSYDLVQGNFEGIGVQFNMSEDTLLVIQPVVGGPSEKKGIMAGDRIVTVNDTAIAGVKMSREEIMRRLRGRKGTLVRLGVVRRGIKGMLHFDIIRDKIPVKTIVASYMIRPTIGYIRIGSFGAQTHEEFRERLKALKAQGMTSLILDLQGNGGGYMHAAVEIANEMLHAGDLIVYMEGRQASRKDYKARGKGLFEEGQLAVLIDSYSASAAEIVTGAIQDQDRGIVVGRRSYGKGLVQRPVDLPDGSMIRLTIAHYFTPSGRCIQKPYVKGKAEDYAIYQPDQWRTATCRQHTFCRLTEMLYTAPTPYGLWRRRYHARPLCATRYYNLYSLLQRDCCQIIYHQCQSALCGYTSQAVAKAVSCI